MEAPELVAMLESCQREITRLQSMIEEIDRVRIVPLEQEVERLRKPGDERIKPEPGP